MTKTSYRRITLALILLGAALAAASWTLHRQAPAPPRRAGGEGQGSSVQRAFAPSERPAPLQPVNLYDAAGTWRDHAGRRLSLESWRGRSTVLTFAYTSCEKMCPVVVDVLAEALAHVPDARQRARVAVVSFDPATDTAARMRGWLAEQDVAARGWRMLTTDEAAALRDLAGRVGFSFERRSPGLFKHNTVIAVTGGEGRLRARWPAHEMAPEALGRAIARALRAGGA